MHCDAACVAKLQAVLSDALTLEPARLLQELQLRYFQGLRHFGPPPPPTSCRTPPPEGPITAATELARNTHTPAVLVALPDTGEVALFAEDFAMDAFPVAATAALERALGGSKSSASVLTVRDLGAGAGNEDESGAASESQALRVAKALVDRGICCRLS